MLLSLRANRQSLNKGQFKFAQIFKQIYSPAMDNNDTDVPIQRCCSIHSNIYKAADYRIMMNTAAQQTEKIAKVRRL